MSLASTRNDTGCKHCGNHYTENYKRGYCSPLCYHKAKGERLYNLIRHDHTHCVNCGTQLKEVEEPTDETLRQIDGLHSANAVIGYQYTTPNAVSGEKPIFSDDGRERIVSGIVCGECGNASHNRAFPEWQDRKLFEYSQRIFELLVEKQDEHHTELDRGVFFEMLYSTGDLVFSLGKAAHVDG